MSITIWTKPKSFFLFALGAIILVTPEWFFGLFGLELGDAGSVVARMYGAVFFPSALTMLKVTGVENFSSKEAFDHMLGDAIAFVVLLIAQLGGVMNQFGWVLVATCLLSALGFYWCYLQARQVSSQYQQTPA